MTREQQTAILISILCVFGVIAAYNWPDPDFSSMSGYQRCEYRGWYKHHGGSESACKDAVLKQAARNLSS